MAGEPREFLTLVNVGPGQNFSQYTAGDASPGVDVRTRFERVRFDVETLVGFGNIDLRGTPFALGQWCLGGRALAGGAVLREQEQVVDLTAAGGCAWASMVDNCRVNPAEGADGYSVRLRFVDEVPPAGP